MKPSEPVTSTVIWSVIGTDHYPERHAPGVLLLDDGGAENAAPRLEHRAAAGKAAPIA
jgi:hypothetical protein